jgi:hypothetical protein
MVRIHLCGDRVQLFIRLTAISFAPLLFVFVFFLLLFVKQVNGQSHPRFAHSNAETQD